MDDPTRSITISVDYFKTDYKTGEKVFSHSSPTTLESSFLFCLHCGAQAVWKQPPECGDQYMGELHLCTACEYRFTVALSPEPCVEPEYAQLIQALRMAAMV